MAFRLPSGERVQRRFDGARTLQDAFDYLEAEHGSEYRPTTNPCPRLPI